MGCLIIDIYVSRILTWNSNKRTLWVYSDYIEIFNQLDGYITKALDAPTSIPTPMAYQIKYVLHDLSEYQAQKENDGKTLEGSSVFYFDIFFNDTSEQYVPIINSSSLDIFSPDSDTVKILEQLYVGIPRFVNLLDSSIWSYYVVRGDTALLNTTITQIIINYEKSLYSLAISNECANINYRMAKESFIYFHGGVAHANISPFLFHSERKMKLKWLGDKDKGIKGVVDPIKVMLNMHKLKWRILFVDDHYNTNMSAIGSIQVTKEMILNHSLEDIANALDVHKDIFEIVYAKDIAEAKKKLLTSRYDIILLDYLLGEPNQKREYGYMLLSEISSFLKKNENETSEQAALRKQWEDAKGICGRFWFMFSSGFTYAVQERLLSEGYSHSDENWYIGRTACPTTTPELFKYNLLSLMNRQLVYISEQGMERDKGIVTFIEFLNYIFEDLRETRSRSIDNFNVLLHIRKRYDIVKNDYYMGGKENDDAKANGSPLIQSLFLDMDCYSNAFWEHTQHLIYLIAYGNILQWNEMWDEYIFIRENLKKAERLIKGEETVRIEESICTNIEQYIIGIKSANFK